MFEKIKHRWHVNTLDLVLIICTFAVGGSLCGYLSKKIISLLTIEKGIIWVIIYFIILTLIWPICVLMISIPFGQLSFFKQYLYKMWKRMTVNDTTPIQIAIFASGAGSNAEKIIEQSLLSINAGDDTYNISLIVCNNPKAGVLDIANKHHIDTLVINKEQFLNGDGYVPDLQRYNIEFIILAGFLLKLPVSVINAYPNKIINIHPALLPKYGGKGMYGSKVHAAVIAAQEKESGITIHYVDEIYDNGAVIFQATCEITADDTPDTLAKKIHLLEHQHYPQQIEKLMKMQIGVKIKP